MNTLEAHARDVLLQRRRTLVLRLASDEAYAHELQSHSPVDLLDQALVHDNATLMARLTDSEREHLGEIDTALERLQAGTFGLCERCGRAIGGQRLQAIPEARRCISCSER